MMRPAAAPPEDQRNGPTPAPSHHRRHRTAPARAEDQRNGPTHDAPYGRGRRAAAAPEDQRGDYAVFVAVIVGALLFLGGLAYDGPRIIAARQDAAHAANEAARVAAATIASGGSLQQAEEAAQSRADTGLIYGQAVQVVYLDCVGARVEVGIVSRYVYRSAMRLIRGRQTIGAVGAAEAVLVVPGDQPNTLHYLGECPLPVP